MTFDEAIKHILTQDEGKRLKPYVDTVGKVSIGIGRNLSDVGISEQECDILFENDLERAIKTFQDNFPALGTQLVDARRLVMICMIFNMGINRFLGFKKLIDAIQRRDYAAAADEMLDSTWAKQVGDRAVRLAQIMNTGTLPP